MKIDKNVPIPSIVGKGKNERFPFEDMAVGDSFACADAKELKAARNAAYLYRKARLQEGEHWDYGSVKLNEGGRLWRTNCKCELCRPE